MTDWGGEMFRPLPLTRLEIGPYEEWNGSEAAVVPGVRRTSLHFGRYAEPALYRPALAAIASALKQSRPELTLWALGRDDFGSNSRRLEEKLYDVRLRKRVERLQAQLRLNLVRSDHALYALQLGTPGDVDFSCALFMQPGDDIRLLEQALEENGSFIAAIARLGAVAIDFTDDRDLLVCDLITDPSDDVEPIFRSWVDASAPGLVR